MNFEQRGNVMRIAPGLYRIQLARGSRMVRIRDVRTVAAPKHASGAMPSRLSLNLLKGADSAVFLHSLRAAKELLAKGQALATDGCPVSPAGYCPHGYPSNAVLWGLV